MKTIENAYELISDNKQEVENYTMRSNMMDVIADIIKLNNLTQESAANILGVTQPRVSDLKKGKISRFSIDSLMMMLSKFGYKFEFGYKEGQVSMSVSIPLRGSNG